MTRDMELVRKILLYIEENYVDIALYDFKIEGYDLKNIAYHCKLCFENGLITDYKGSYAEGELRDFWVGSLTWKGHDFLEKIRSENTWNKTKKVIKEKGLAMNISIVEKVATKLLEVAVQSAINGIH